MKRFIRINELDNVGVALTDLEKGEVIGLHNFKIELQEGINRGHKFALRVIKTDEDVVKYGSPIGYATKTIQTGEWVHAHNTKTNLEGVSEYRFSQKLNEIIEENRGLTFADRKSVV